MKHFVAFSVNYGFLIAGVDDLLIEEGDHYLFWYKKL